MSEDPVFDTRPMALTLFGRRPAVRRKPLIFIQYIPSFPQVMKDLSKNFTPNRPKKPRPKTEKELAELPGKNNTVSPPEGKKIEHEPKRSKTPRVFAGLGPPLIWQFLEAFPAFQRGKSGQQLLASHGRPQKEGGEIRDDMDHIGVDMDHIGVSLRCICSV